MLQWFCVGLIERRVLCSMALDKRSVHFSKWKALSRVVLLFPRAVSVAVVQRSDPNPGQAFLFFFLTVLGDSLVLQSSFLLVNVHSVLRDQRDSILSAVFPLDCISVIDTWHLAYLNQKLKRKGFPAATSSLHTCLFICVCFHQICCPRSIIMLKCWGS